MDTFPSYHPLFLHSLEDFITMASLRFAPATETLGILEFNQVQLPESNLSFQVHRIPVAHCVSVRLSFHYEDVAPLGAPIDANVSRLPPWWGACAHVHYFRDHGHVSLMKRFIHFRAIMRDH